MPDDTNWFEVAAHGRCPQCGLTASDVSRLDLGSAIVAEADRWYEFLAKEASGATSALRERPQRHIWSPLEYAAHVRDVLALFAARVELARAQHGATFGWWDHDAAAVIDGYNEQDPGLVATALVTNAKGFGDLLADLEEGEWVRAGTRRRNERFTIEGLARFALHEAHHHHWDATHGRAPHNRAGPAPEA